MLLIRVFKLERDIKNLTDYQHSLVPECLTAWFYLVLPGFTWYYLDGGASDVMILFEVLKHNKS